MCNITRLSILLFLSLFVISSVMAKTVEVATQRQFDDAMLNVVSGDTILWLSGTYRNIKLEITKNNLMVKAKVAGATIFSGSSWAYIKGSNVTFEGFQFLNGDIGSANVINVSGTGNYISEVNISGYISHKYLVIRKESQYTTVKYCNFENRINLADKNILSILVNEQQPGFHRIQYCSFKNFGGKGGDMGMEPVRVGTSAQSQFDSKSIVEYCYFTKCSGDGEIISNKSGKNIFRYNTFINNPLAELVLRHGSGSYVYGNFFLNGKGGIRIKEGGDHYVFNNYFSGLSDRSIILQCDKLDPLRDIYIMHNTFVGTGRVKLGGSGIAHPKRVTIANNLFDAPIKTVASNPTGNETWIGNMYTGSLGMSKQKGLQKVSSQLKKNTYSFYEIKKNSLAINSSEKGCPKLPVYKGLDPDYSLSYDILEQNRPVGANQKDVGCQEFNADSVLKPFATHRNTGPVYLIDASNSKYTYESY